MSHNDNPAPSGRIPGARRADFVDLFHAGIGPLGVATGLDRGRFSKGVVVDGVTTPMRSIELSEYGNANNCEKR